MPQFNWTRWFQSFLGRKPGTVIRRDRIRLNLETLEARLAPASRIWDGGGADNRWSTAANWVGDVAPSPNDDLVFAASALQKNNQNDFTNRTFNSLTFSGTGYNIVGNTFTLGTSAFNSGNLIVNAAGSTNTVGLNIQLGGAAGNRQYFTVGGAGAVLNVNGQLLGSTGVEMVKDGGGTLVLAGNNVGFTGQITLSQGITRVASATALGSAATGTTVFANAQIQVANIAGPILEPLLLNGNGISNDGVLLATSGTSTWGSNLVLGSSVYLGANAGAQLTIAGQISDSGVANITKEGAGLIAFANDNTYHGLTTVSHGILSVQSALALGDSGTVGSGTVVNSDLLGSASLRLDAPASSTGIVVANEFLTLNGFGFNNQGALLNNVGDNEWTGPVTLGSTPPFGSDVAIGVASTATGVTNLTISGVIKDNPTNVFNLTKILPGRLILTNANTYTGTTDIFAGSINIRDSKALGATGATSDTLVFNGAALELQTDALVDSVTGNASDLNVGESVVLVGNGIGATGALRNVWGHNEYSGPINLFGSASIGVEPDPDPDGTVDAVDWDNFSQLTVTGVISGGRFDKVGTGELVLPGANTYTGDTNIVAGWITIRHNNALGTPVAGVTDTRQQGTAVFDGAALHLKPDLLGNDLNVFENIVISGLGVDFRDYSTTIPTTGASYVQTTQRGALLNLGGNNLMRGDVAFAANTAIGVQVGQNVGTPTSELTISGTINDAGGTGFSFTKLGDRRLILEGPGNYSGAVDIKEGVLRIKNDTALGLRTVAGGSTTTVRDGAALELDVPLAGYNGGFTTGLDIVNESLVLYGTGNTTFGPVIQPLTILAGDHQWRGPITLANDVTLNLPVSTQLLVSGSIGDSLNLLPIGSALTKNGAGKLVLTAANTYRGLTSVNQGIVNIQNSSALGTIDAGTVVANGAALELQGNLNVGGESLTIEGQGLAVPSAMPPHWYAQGPGPIQVGATSNPTTGRVTGVVADPQDPNVFYISAAGGGAWKTTNGGQTWVSLSDNLASLFGGAIAIAPSDPNIIYLGTGEANNSIQSFYGRGVYKSTDGGKTWTLLLNANNSNPLDRRAVSRIVVDAANPDLIYVATSDLAANAQTGNAGIWRFNAANAIHWTNITSTVSANRATPGTPGPDDDFRVSFPQTNATWSDLTLENGVLYAALGTASFGNLNNAVFRTANPSAALPNWNVCDGAVDSQAAGFPNGSSGDPTNGRIRFAIAGTNLINPLARTIYAAVAAPRPQFFSSENDTAVIQSIQVSTDLGVTWAAATNPGFLGNRLWTDLAVAGDPNNQAIVYVGGTSGLGRSTDSGATWTNLFTLPGSPNQGVQSLSIAANGDLVVGTRGGVWVYTPATSTWKNANGDLEITQFNGLAVDPSDPNVAYGGTQNNGTVGFNGSLPWQLLPGTAGNGGFVRVDPNNPSTIYHTFSRGSAVFVERSFDNGQTWTNISAGLGGVAGASFIPAFIVDPTDPKRLLIGTDDVYESNDQGNTWVKLNLGFGPGIDAIAVAGSQGTFVLDPNFPNVTDKGASVYDSQTIYLTSTDGAGNGTLFVTKDHGTTFTQRDTANGLPNGALFSDIIVDPRNRDTAYVANSTFNGGGVYATTDAGQTWTNFSFNLPSIPVYKIVLDPRNGDLYAGTDNGVWKLTFGSNSWQRFGAGLPFTQVHELVLNQGLNILSAGTDGRSMFNVSLDAPKANAGALRALSGSSVWSGPILLSGDATVSADGTQAYEGAGAAASLTLLGVVSGNHDLTKIGGGDVVLAGANTYTGLTTVAEGVLVARNPQALGSTGQGTVVNSGAALELQANVVGEPLQLFGNGFSLNGHSTGALRNVSFNNTYSGPITLMSDATIGVDTGSQLTISGSIGDGGAGYGLTKELTGRLVLTGANTHGGLTTVEQGILNASNAQAFGTGGTAASGTVVKDGAQLQLQGGVAFTSENLTLSGTGVFGSGALQNISGNNTWQGPVDLAKLPGFSPTTTPADNVIINVVGATDTLTINGPVGNLPAVPVGFVKTGPGTLVLKQADTYAGLTDVAKGTLIIEDSLGLGTATGPADGTIVRSGATLGLRNAASVIVGSENLTISGTGVGGLGVVRNLQGVNSWGGPVTLGSDVVVNTEPTTKLVFAAPITDGANTFGLTKLGTGNLALSAVNTYDGTTTISAGNVEVGDGVSPASVANVSINGGALSGHGTVGNVVSTAAGGAVSPGNVAIPTAILSTGAVTWNSSTSFSVHINGTTPGTQHDQLASTGIVNLGGALLTGTVLNSTALDTYTIITATSVLGRFGNAPTNGQLLFIDGKKFSIAYNSNSVVLTRVKSTITGITLVASPASSTGYGQTATFNATLVPEAGATVANGTATVVFLIDGNPSAPVNVVNGVASLPLNNLSVGAHTIVATFAGNADFNASPNSSTLNYTIVKSTPTPSFASSANASVFGQAVNITVTVVPPGIGTPTGQVTLFVDGVSQGFQNLAGGIATFTVNSAQLGVGNHSVKATYSGNSNFNAFTNLGSFVQVVNKAGVNVSVSPNPVSNIYGDNVTFTAAVAATAPGAGSPTGTVSFYDGIAVPANLIGTGTISAGIATLTIASLPVAVHTITAVYNGSGNFLTGSGTNSYTVTQANTTTTVATSGTPSDYGATVNFTATIAANPGRPGSTPPTGTVTFTIDGSQIYTRNVVAGVATLSLADTNVLTIGSHTVSAVYNGDVNYTTSNNTLAGGQVVSKGTPGFTVVPSSNPSAIGAAVQFDVTVLKNFNISPTPTGTVDLFIDGVEVQSNATLDGLGKTSFIVSNTAQLSQGGHSIYVHYDGDSSYFTADSTPFTQSVNAGTVTTVTSSQPSTVSGENVTFFATIAVNLPGAGVATGFVDFYVDNVRVAQNVSLQNVGGFGQATFTTNTLPAGTHQVYANYLGDPGFFGSSGNLSPDHVVNKADTATTLVTTASPALVGQAIITATVNPVSPGGGFPTGTVTFTITNTATNAVSTKTANLIVGTATLPFLGAGDYTIVAKYNGSSDYNVSGDSNTISQTINRANSDPVFTVAPATSVFGQPVTFTVTVGAQSPASGIPTGAVNFLVDGILVAANVPLNSLGRANFNVGNLSVATHTIRVDYLGDANYFASTSSTSIITSKATTTTTLASSSPTAYSGASVTFGATVRPVSPSTAVPTGTVTFIIDNVVVATVAVNASGVARYATSSLAAGTHTVKAVYNGSAGFVTSTSTNLTQTIRVQPLAFRPVPASVRSGSLFNVAVNVRNAAGAYDTAFNGFVTIALNSAPAGGKLTGVLSVRAVNGIATFTNLSLNRTGSYTLRATGANSPPAISTSINTVAAKFAGVVDLTNRGTVVNTSGLTATIPFALVVYAQDINGLTATNFNGPVVLSLISAPAGGQIKGPLSGNMVNGVLVLKNLTVNVAGNYVLKITSGTTVGYVTIVGRGRRS